MSKKPAVNAPCPCGSGKKFKKCCGSPSRQSSHSFGPRPKSIGIQHPERAIRLPLPVAPWQSDSGLPCPCGSGKPYKNCCKITLAQNKDGLPRKARERLIAADYVEAESLYRAYLVQYLEWVYAHTVPFARAEPSAAEPIVDLDREALTDLAHMVSHCFYASGKKSEVLPFLNQLERQVPLEGFGKNAAYLRATWLYIGLKDKAGAIRELEKLGDILEYARREAWELYLDVHALDIPERRTIEIAERIVSDAAGDEYVRVQYTVIRALALFRLGEAEEARKALDKLLGSLSPIAQSEEVTRVQTEWHIAKAWSFYGEIFHDQTALAKAEELILKIREISLKAAGKAALRRDLGHVLRAQERYCDSAAAFEDSLVYEESLVGRIQLIYSLALCGRVEEAQSSLAKIDEDSVSPELRLEYLVAQGSLAIAANDPNLAGKTVQSLRGFTIESLFWDGQRTQLLIQLLDFLHRPQAVPEPERQRRLSKIVLSINELVELRPNFFGLGVNINKIIEKLAKRDS